MLCIKNDIYSRNFFLPSLSLLDFALEHEGSDLCLLQILVLQLEVLSHSGLRPVSFPFIPKSCQPDLYVSVGHWRLAVRVKPDSWQTDRLSGPGEQWEGWPLRRKQPTALKATESKVILLTVSACYTLFCLVWERLLPRNLFPERRGLLPQGPKNHLP